MNKPRIPHEDVSTGPATKKPSDAADSGPAVQHSQEQKDRISARAYVKAQHRTSNDAGNADKDWLDAEREIDSATKGDRR